MDVATWLRDLGLARYADRFRENDIDAHVLRTLDAEDLKELGVTSLGHRKRLLEALAALGTTSGDAVSPPQVRTREAERRQLTVMFVDLVGSTALAGRLDPEDMRDVITAYQNACAEVIGRFEGHVAKYMGDGVLAYFGYPRAHEDDAERAVRAGLEVAAAVARQEADGQALAARVGIATGQVVVGDLIGEGAAQEEAVVGETPNLAARLQGLAAPGTVIIASVTRRLLGGLFDVEDLGDNELKGYATPVPAWRVLGESPAEGRFEALRGERLTPMVGRERELDLLMERWQLAKAGEGQIVLLSGEPGIGKSRITQVLRQRLRDEAQGDPQLQCSPHRINSALHPFIQQLSHAAGLAAGDPDQIALDKLERLMIQGTANVGQAVPLLAELLSIAPGERYAPVDLAPARRKSATFEVLLDQLGAIARRGPVLMLFEDMHWADPTSREWWDLAVPRIAKLPTLAVITFRPTLALPWADDGHVTLLSLNRLGRQQAAAIATRVAGDTELPAALLDGILDKAEGNPLFVEELTKTVIESALQHSDVVPESDRSLSIPATLQDSLMARLDRLPAVKGVAQLAATIGRSFDQPLLAAVASLNQADLTSALDQLVGAGIIYRRLPEASYEFKHALVCDAAYNSLLKSTRRQHHHRIAGALERDFPALVESAPEIVAHHFTEAGLASEGATHWYRAGRRALEISAYREAIDHLERVLTLLHSLPAGGERDARELEVQLALGAAWIAAKAYSADEVRQAYDAAVELSRRAGDATQRFAALRGLWNNHLMRVELTTARELAVELKAAAEASDDVERRLVAERSHGSVLMALGDHREANACFHRGISCYDPDRHRHYVRVYGEDPGLWCLGYAGWTDDWLGQRDRAVAEIRRAIEIARGLPTPNMLAMTLSNATTLFQFRGDLDDTVACAAETTEIADRLGVVQFRAWASIHEGWALACGGRVADGLAKIEDGLATWRAIGGLNNRTHFLNLLSEVCRLAGQPDAGMAALDEAEDIASRFDLHAHDLETLRRRGELLRVLGRKREAETVWLTAIDRARSSETKTLELRTVVNVARLWHDQGKRREAHDLLAPIYDWFTEGFDTQDLKDAKALLDQLA